ncbi:mycothiol synthase [Vallicoccus soli]|uniref:Mycothiol acetyltransferase n=1 Tax=Vallicoccus soli TaxID=2339232 RepID=A0A3A3Z9F8_9ACTN|nr:mycothiol synthase [Vallicoccus soli]RJK97716.1 mycothiol synthase [Vallicoccus soli]
MVEERLARVEVLPRLEPAELQRVAWLVEQATDEDGVRPLGEQTTLQLRHGGGTTVLLWAGDELAGAAHLDPGTGTGEAVVAPALRRRGYGRALVAALLEEAAGAPVRLWAHGDHAGAAALAARLGLARVRELWRMRRPLDGALARPAPPPGVVLRTFVPGQDDEAWVALNARAFAHHPEQGRMTVEDLRLRREEPWFDPDGFFLAEREGRLVAFHWTKVHGSGPEALGEVYVVGVDPSAQGLGLGSLVTLVGLRHLQARGLPAVMLYVDGDNEAALRTYRGLGFVRWDVDVAYGRAVHLAVGE